MFPWFAPKCLSEVIKNWSPKKSPKIHLAGGAMCTSWKMMEFVNVGRMTSHCNEMENKIPWFETTNQVLYGWYNDIIYVCMCIYMYIYLYIIPFMFQTTNQCRIPKFQSFSKSRPNPNGNPPMVYSENPEIPMILSRWRELLNDITLSNLISIILVEKNDY